MYACSNYGKIKSKIRKYTRRLYIYADLANGLHSESSFPLPPHCHLCPVTSGFWYSARVPRPLGPSYSTTPCPLRHESRYPFGSRFSEESAAETRPFVFADDKSCAYPAPLSVLVSKERETLDFAKVTWTSPGTAGGEQKKATGGRKARKNERSKDGNFFLFFFTFFHTSASIRFSYTSSYSTRGTTRRRAGEHGKRKWAAAVEREKERTRRLQRKRVRKLGDSIVPAAIDDSQRKRVILRRVFSLYTAT